MAYRDPIEGTTFLPATTYSACPNCQHPVDITGPLARAQRDLIEQVATLLHKNADREKLLDALDETHRLLHELVETDVRDETSYLHLRRLREAIESPATTPPPSRRARAPQ